MKTKSKDSLVWNLPVGCLHQNVPSLVCSTHPANLAVLKILEAEHIYGSK